MIFDLVNHKSSKFGKCRSILYGLEMGGIKATWLLPTKAHSSSRSAKPKERLLSLCPMGPTILLPDLATYLITHVQGKEEHQHPCGRVPPVMLCPSVMDVLEEGWVIDLDLGGENLTGT